MQLNITNETSLLQTVVIGQPYSIGKQPKLDEAYDAKSYQSIKDKIYPSESKIVNEMLCLEKILKKYGVEVLQPKILKEYNQVFARDVAFVIDDKIVISNMIADREEEQEAYEEIFKSINFKNIYNLPKKANVEGGDIVLTDEVVFCGVYKGSDFSQIKTARTNPYAIEYLKELYPNKIFKELQLKKNDKDPRKGVLHLDCTFMPIGKNKAILYKESFANEEDYHFLVDYFGIENIFELTESEVFYINSNVFSISPEVVISEEKFIRLNQFLENEWNFKVEKIPYYEISKMGGLLRCSTLPLVRKK
ncbi:amidinotransferase [Apibacter muscae]|uniref:dimethylarginine dimethylaminohydrolase family protein n=1 Tax=Apibacter muscae TaxID=2509004 RepID=UPI0011AC3FCB|nr:arginine deiminase family protein [Apibacter muscae]TWP31018.1 amidinotransferase [Apibacter muscae]